MQQYALALRYVCNYILWFHCMFFKSLQLVEKVNLTALHKKTKTAQHNLGYFSCWTQKAAYLEMKMLHFAITAIGSKQQYAGSKHPSQTAPPVASSGHAT